MIARWWRRQRPSRHCREVWHLVVLRPTSCSWVTLSVVVWSRRHVEWVAMSSLTPDGRGSVPIGGDIRASHARRCDALHAAESVWGFARSVKHANWPAIDVWDRSTPPAARRGRQLARASRGDIALIAAFSAHERLCENLLRADRAAARLPVLMILADEIRPRALIASARNHLAFGRIAAARELLERAHRVAVAYVGALAFNDIHGASEALDQFAAARAALHEV